MVVRPGRVAAKVLRGALDTFAEQNGRRQVALLHGLCDEVSELMPQLLNDTLPTGVREELTRKGTEVSRHAAALKKQLETVENHTLQDPKPWPKPWPKVWPWWGALVVPWWD